jgi:chromosomal replication initiation ATPase DnaA
MNAREDENRIVNNNYFESNLDNRFKFENFVSGDSNDLAFAASQKLASGEEIGANTLLIYGGVGYGKTHLLQSIAHYLREHNLRRRLYTFQLKNSCSSLLRPSARKIWLRSKNIFVMLIFFLLMIYSSSAAK